ncbi:hypothetical protein H2200_008829 [Cladophialophora chaetospira]|uniref:Apple domain-containing protein n=1 Tax=Cladophialophora chaetospira TaxID=386627 RepID=A0AA39CFY3_9EURO|nr:hypothetical protein H2200_008829 [Cladophialophora chaetospira]
MWRSTLSLFLVSPTVATKPYLLERAETPFGLNDTCSPSETATVEVQPVYFSGYILENTIIDPFHNGHALTITNAPTVVITTSYLTTLLPPTKGRDGHMTSPQIIFPSELFSSTTPLIPSVSPGSTLSSSITFPSALFSQSSHMNTGASAESLSSTASHDTLTSTQTLPSQTSSPAGGSSPYSGLSPLSPGASYTASFSNGEGPTLTSGSAEPSTPFGSASLSNQPPSTPFADSTSSYTAASSPQITTLPPLSIGEGIPSGILTSLPSSNRIVLAFSDLNIKQPDRRDLGKRQDGGQDDQPTGLSTGTASAVSVVNLATVGPSAASGSGVPTLQNAVSQDNCDDATPFILSDGLLLTGGQAVGKLVGSTAALLGSLQNPPDDQVNKTFLIVDGYLQWSTDDVGVATFYSCENGALWAGFPSAPVSSCTSVLVGAVAASACASRVQQTATLNPELLNTTATSGMMTSNSPSGPNPTSIGDISTGPPTSLPPLSLSPLQSTTTSVRQTPRANTVAGAANSSAFSLSISASGSGSALPVGSSSPSGRPLSDSNLPSSFAVARSSALPTAGTSSNRAGTSSESSASSPGNFGSPSNGAALSTPSIGNSGSPAANTLSHASIASNEAGSTVSSIPVVISDLTVSTSSTVVSGSQPSATATPSGTPLLSSQTLSGFGVSAISSVVVQSIIVTETTSTGLPMNTLCNEDDCLRNLIDPRYSSLATTFCPTYTQTTAGAIPTWLGGCAGSSSQISSACSCFITSTRSVSSFLISSSSLNTSQTSALSSGHTGTTTISVTKFSVESTPTSYSTLSDDESSSKPRAESLASPTTSNSLASSSTSMSSPLSQSTGSPSMVSAQLATPGLTGSPPISLPLYSSLTTLTVTYRPSAFTTYTIETPTTSSVYLNTRSQDSYPVLAPTSSSTPNLNSNTVKTTEYATFTTSYVIRSTTTMTMSLTATLFGQSELPAISTMYHGSLSSNPMSAFPTPSMSSKSAVSNEGDVLSSLINQDSPWTASTGRANEVSMMTNEAYFGVSSFTISTTSISNRRTWTPTDTGFGPTSSLLDADPSTSAFTEIPAPSSLVGATSLTYFISSGATTIFATTAGSPTNGISSSLAQVASVSQGTANGVSAASTAASSPSSGVQASPTTVSPVYGTAGAVNSLTSGSSQPSFASALSSSLQSNFASAVAASLQSASMTATTTTIQPVPGSTTALPQVTSQSNAAFLPSSQSVSQASSVLLLSSQSAPPSNTVVLHSSQPPSQVNSVSLAFSQSVSQSNIFVSTSSRSTFQAYSASLTKSSSSATASVSAGLGSLCSGQSVSNGGAFIVGSHNYEVVQPGSNSYEIECYARQDSATTSENTLPNTATFEGCIAQCDEANANSAGSCQGVSYDASTQSCLAISQFSSTVYPRFGLNTRTARLISNAYPVINDAFYLQPTSTTGLGLCDSQAYSFDAISPQYSGSFDNLYENQCGRYFNGDPNSAVDQSTVTSWANSILSAGISSTDDCLKVCDYGNHVSSQYRCVAYVFQTTSAQCMLYGATDGTVTTDPAFNGGRLLNAALGYGTPTDRPQPNGYVAGYQYVSTSAASSSSPSAEFSTMTPASASSMTVAFFSSTTPASSSSMAGPSATTLAASQASSQTASTASLVSVSPQLQSSYSYIMSTRSSTTTPGTTQTQYASSDTTAAAVSAVVNTESGISSLFTSASLSSIQASSSDAISSSQVLGQDQTSSASDIGLSTSSQQQGSTQSFSVSMTAASSSLQQQNSDQSSTISGIAGGSAVSTPGQSSSGASSSDLLSTSFSGLSTPVTSVSISQSSASLTGVGGSSLTSTVLTGSTTPATQASTTSEALLTSSSPSSISSSSAVSSSITSSSSPGTSDGTQSSIASISTQTLSISTDSSSTQQGSLSTQPEATTTQQESSTTQQGQPGLTSSAFDTSFSSVLNSVTAATIDPGSVSSQSTVTGTTSAAETTSGVETTSEAATTSEAETTSASETSAPETTSATEATSVSKTTSVVGTISTTDNLSMTSTTTSASATSTSSLPSCVAGLQGNYGPNNFILAIAAGNGALVPFCIVVDAGAGSTTSAVSGPYVTASTTDTGTATSASASSSTSPLPPCTPGLTGNYGTDNSIFAVQLGNGALVPFCLVADIDSSSSTASSVTETITATQSESNTGSLTTPTSSTSATPTSLPTCPVGTIGNSGPNNSIYATFDTDLSSLISVCVVAGVDTGGSSTSAGTQSGSMTDSAASATSSPASNLPNCPPNTLGNYGPNNSEYALLNTQLGQLVAICVIAASGSVSTSTTSQMLAGTSSSVGVSFGSSTFGGATTQSATPSATTSAASLPYCSAGEVGNHGPNNSIYGVDLGGGNFLDLCIAVLSGSTAASGSTSSAAAVSNSAAAGSASSTAAGSITSVPSVSPAAATSVTTSSIPDCPSSITSGQPDQLERLDPLHGCKPGRDSAGDHIYTGDDFRGLCRCIDDRQLGGTCRDDNSYIYISSNDCHIAADNNGYDIERCHECFNDNSSPEHHNSISHYHGKQ